MMCSPLCLAAIITVICFSSLHVVSSTRYSVSSSEGRQVKAKRNKKPPNIILLLTDDQDVLLGGLDHMPILHRLLKKRGTTFRNAFVHTPICCPSRSSILTGRYLHNGMALNNSVSGNCNGQQWQDDAERHTFAVHAKDAGYVTSYAGKYLNQYGVPGSPGCPKRQTSSGENGSDVSPPPGCSRVPPGWDKWLGLVGNSRYYDYQTVESNDGGRTYHRVHHGKRYETDYFPDVIANRTLRIIDEFTSVPSEHSKPFLIVNAWPTPHGPFTPAPWAEHLYDGLKAHRTPNFNATRKAMLQKHWIMRQLGPLDDDTVDYIDTMYRHRLEALRSVDDHIGRIINLLEAKNELDNTYIIYTSDNGFQLGQHRLRGDKRHLYEHDIRVPFIVTGPDVPVNVTTEQIVLNIDIAPTILELVTGSTILPRNMDGISFLPILTSRGENGDNRSNNAGRTDFLVSYHGEGDPQCGLAECPMPSPWHGGDMPDSFNNTYDCIRTIKPKGGNANVLLRTAEEDVVDTVDTIFCGFNDTEKFVEYYDLTVDEWQLTNRYHELSNEERRWFVGRLEYLRRCQGDDCRANGVRPHVVTES